MLGSLKQDKFSTQKRRRIVTQIYQIGIENTILDGNPKLQKIQQPAQRLTLAKKTILKQEESNRSLELPHHNAPQAEPDPASSSGSQA